MNSTIRAAGFSAILAVVAACGEHRTLTPKSAADLTVGRGVLTAAAQLPEVRISEFHYDNGAADVDELVEISGPAGMSLDGWSLVLYNGNPNARSPYSTTRLDGYTIPTTEGCGARGALVITPVSDIPDASTSRTATNDPDGMALVNGSTVVDLLAYEGTFVGAAGVAADRTFPNIGVRERAVAPEPTTAPVWSLKRDITNVWSGPSPNSFGACNDNEPPAAQEVDHISVSPGATSVALGATQQLTATAFDAANAKIDGASTSWSSSDPLTASVDAAGLVTTFRTGVVTITVTAPNDVIGTALLYIEDAGLPDVRFTEFHYDNAGSDVNEFIEIEGPVGTDLTGWIIALYDGDSGSMYYSHVIEGALTEEQCGGRATLFIGPPPEIFQNGRPGDGSTGNADGVALIKPADELHPYPQVVEFLSYEGVLTATGGPAEGKRSTDIGKTEGSTSLRTESLQRMRDGSAWYGPSAATFGACNVDPVVTIPNTVLFTGRGQTDPVLPVGFEDQLVATEYDAVTNEPVPTTFIWTTETSDISTVNGNGVVHAWAPGEAIIRATAADGATATWKLQLGDPAVSTTPTGRATRSLASRWAGTTRSSVAISSRRP